MFNFNSLKNLFRSLRSKTANNDPLEELSRDFSTENADNEEQPMAIVNGKTPEQASLLHTGAPKAFGIKKNLAIGLICAFVAVFLGSLVFGLGDNKAKPVSGEINPNNNQGGATQSEAVNKLPNNYQDLAKYNNKTLPGQQQTGTAAPGQIQNGAVTPQYSNQAQGGNQPAYSKIPSSGSYQQTMPGAYGEGYYSQQVPIGQNGGGNYMEQVAEYIKSPIRFTLAAASATGTAGDVQNNGISAPAVAAANSQPKQASTIQPVPYTLQAGTLIPATLMTGVNSDLSGEVVAQVRQNVYDSVTGNYLLIPQGSRLVGEYGGTKIGNGQERIAVAWKRLYLTNGVAIILDGMNSVDGGGYPGMQDKVDNHTGRLIGATLASSILAAGAQIAAGNTNASDNMTSGQLAVQGSAANLMNAGTKLIERDMNINPTITIRPGFVFNVFINKDLVLQPYNN